MRGLKRKTKTPTPILASSAAVLLNFLLLSVNPLSVAASYDFLLLVRQFGPTFCETTSCTKDPPAAFTLHGLWPNYANGDYPSFCSNAKFAVSSLPQTLQNRLACEWPSYTGASSESFWANEWKKHGTCAPDLFPQPEDYFTGTLDLNDRYDINNVLKEAGISVTSTISTSRSKISDALDIAWGRKSLVRCAGSNVYEIWTCFDSKLGIMDCPNGLTSQCSSSGALKFPSGGKVSESCSGYFQPVASTARSSTPTASRTSAATATTTAKQTAAAALTTKTGQTGGATGICAKGASCAGWSLVVGLGLAVVGLMRL